MRPQAVPSHKPPVWPMHKVPLCLAFKSLLPLDTHPSATSQPTDLLVTLTLTYSSLCWNGLPQKLLLPRSPPTPTHSCWNMFCDPLPSNTCS